MIAPAESPANEPEALADQTLRTIGDALKSGRVTSLPEIVRIIRALATDEGKISISDLADMINQDQSVLMRVVAAANTFGYNPTNTEIANVTDAIHTIGFNRVRSLAMSLMLLDHTSRSTTPAEQRQMAAVSLCSGMIAQVAAEHTPLIQPELAFVCASLRNFGRLLLGTFMSDEFRIAKTACDLGEGDEAFKKSFGLTPFELGYQLLKSANLPPVILNAVRQYEPATSEDITWADRATRRLSSFALNLSEIALDSRKSQEEFDLAQAELTRSVAHDFPSIVDAIPEILSNAAQRLSALTRSCGGVSFTESGLRRLRDRARGLSSRESADAGPQAAASTAAPPAEIPAPETPSIPAVPAPPSSERPPANHLSALQQAINILDIDDSGSNALALALNGIWIALHPQDLLYCSADRMGRTFRVKLGKGSLNDWLGERVVFNRADRNVLFLCHDRLTNLSVQDTKDPRVWRHLPEWLQSPDAPRSFLAFPVHHQKSLQGVLIVGWKAPRDTPFGSAEITAIQSLVERVALHQSRASARRS